MVPGQLRLLIYWISCLVYTNVLFAPWLQVLESITVSAIFSSHYFTQSRKSCVFLCLWPFGDGRWWQRCCSWLVDGMSPVKVQKHTVCYIIHTVYPYGPSGSLRQVYSTLNTLHPFTKFLNLWVWFKPWWCLKSTYRLHEQVTLNPYLLFN